MTDINKYAVRSGRIIAEDGTTHNIVDLLGSGDPVSEQQVHDIRKYAAQGGRIIGEDGLIYNLVDLLRNIGGGGGESDPIEWAAVLNKPATYPPSAHNHDDRYYTKDQIDSPGFLSDRVDQVTIVQEGRELKVKTIDGLTLTPEQINVLLSGSSGNIQNQINSINDTLIALTAGMRYLGKLETHADLQNITTMENGDLAVIIADETRSGARTIYVYNGDLAMWDFVGAFEFSDAFTALTDTPANYVNGKVLKSGASSLFYDDVRWAEILDKPDSTKAQIDDAVGKAHEHDNKLTLDRIGIDAQGRITIDGTPYVPATSTKQRLYARRSGSEQALTAGTTCIFNSKYDGDIPYDSATGVFTLEAGKTYRVMVTASMNTTGYVILHLVNAATNAVTSDSNRAIWMDVNVSSTTWHESSAGPLLAYVTPSTTAEYKIRVASVSGTSGLRPSLSALEIQEV